MLSSVLSLQATIRNELSGDPNVVDLLMVDLRTDTAKYS